MRAFYTGFFARGKAASRKRKNTALTWRGPRGTWKLVRSFSSLLGPVVAIVVTALPARADESVLERGAYLARITGCVGCHTPRTPAGGVVEDRLLSGGDHPIPGGPKVRIYPPNITPDRETGIGAWQASDIVNAIKTGTTPGGGRLSTAMPWRSQFASMTDADAAAIAAYLKSVPAIRHSVPAPINVGTAPN